MSRQLQRESFGRCPETCPAVDRAFSDLFDMIVEYMGDDLTRAGQSIILAYIEVASEKVKEVGTCKMRDALTDACNDYLQAEERANDAEREVERLTALLDDARETIRSLENESV